jgi:hypothetical protein
MGALAGFAVVSYIPYFIVNDRKMFGGAFPWLACGHAPKTLGARTRAGARWAARGTERTHARTARARVCARETCACVAGERARARGARAAWQRRACTRWKTHAHAALHALVLCVFRSPPGALQAPCCVRAWRRALCYAVSLWPLKGTTRTVTLFPC